MMPLPTRSTQQTTNQHYDAKANIKRDHVSHNVPAFGKWNCALPTRDGRAGARAAALKFGTPAWR